MKVLVYAPKRDAVFHSIARDMSELTWVFAQTPEAAGSEITDTDVFVTSNLNCTPEVGQALRTHTTRPLPWIHFLSAGYDRVAASGLPPCRIVTCGAGVKSRPVAEHAFALLLALVKKFPTMAENQRQHVWRHDGAIGSTLEDKVVCIVGMGGIARDLARKLAAFDARVIAVTRASDAAPSVEQIFPRERLAQALGLADATVIATHSDATTHHLIDRAAIAAMKPTAFIVNIARGSIIDEAALIQALAEGTIAGAGLDVTDVEPLPQESPMWAMRNVILTPHLAGLGSDSFAQHKALFAANVERFKAGAKLINEVTINPPP